MCGIAGVWNVDNAYNVIHDLLLSLQHRGQQAAGVVVNGFKTVKGEGLVESVLTDERFLEGNRGIGHVRYSTYGSLDEIQPITAYTLKGRISVAHNGNIVDANEKRKFIMESGGIFSTTLDTEIIIHYFSIAPYTNPRESLQWAMSRIKAAYSLVILHDSFLAAARDQFGIRPLFYSKYENGYIVASEDSALRSIGCKCEEIQEVEPGTIIFFTDSNKPEIVKFSRRQDRFCSFEFVYFARPDSNFYGVNTHEVRKMLGRKLYEENRVQADFIVPVLDSGFSGSLGYSQVSGIPIEYGLIRNHYIGRSFIMPKNRQEIVRRKLSPLPSVLEGKEIILIDDSIVRGTTMKIIVDMVREAGAKKVYVGIHSPAVIGSCNYGIDTSRRSELIATRNDAEKLREYVGADKLFYLSVDGYKEVFEGCGVNGICMGCFNLDYPV
ncbi:MAG: amidophosphoribosyltransferase [Fervidobacterium sp.]|uniref:Amidophosphoribosyltransferase n=1 Tax=Fervidobacterium gondwanense DSM 13020 TaxID=1121883 RepID=A0A1M7RYU7_FERGO|nr:amidophosphoribosyltransferase [Fervidobacterium gondwanense]UXF00128.1 amidophosphoribosyltransferase [Fervidobacterium riparium]SHN51371.1 amidophosphoribosyltransferase [Fervidobacterium gondwanense DSM 13020]